MLVDAHSKLLMIGDSITDSERLQQIEELPVQGLGYGYVSYIAGLIGATSPERYIEVVNRGISGNTVRDLKSRWQTDVLDVQPDWVSIMIGINDVWRQFDTADPKQHVDLEEYGQTLEELLSQTNLYVRGIVLMTPYYIEPNLQDPMRKLMDIYGARMAELSTKFKTVFVDVQKAFDKALTVYKPAQLADDKIHPNQVGHMIIARAFLDAVGFAW